MKQPEQIEHKGIVRSVEERMVCVAVEVNEACGSCASRKACSMGQSQTREIAVFTADADRYSVGEVVRVAAKRSMGIMAVVLCYIVPLVVMVGVLAVAVSMGCDEGIAALVSLGVTAVYYMLLASMRKRISNRIIFTINKI